VSVLNTPQLTLAPLYRCLLSACYEALLLAALLWCAGLVFSLVEASLNVDHVRPLFQIYLACVGGFYFIWQWTRGGQTLPMKTWRLRLVARDGAGLRTSQACARYVFALAGLLLLGAGFAWALVDRERQFLHDRLAGTRIVRV
jgi:uncharacterized RDD family membrane protein YckC